jgi:primary-amine oxidase
LNPADTEAPPHPLDPLSAAELERLVEILRSEDDLSATKRLIAADLEEPSKDDLERWAPDTAPSRRARAVILDPAPPLTTEVLASLTDGVVLERRNVEGLPAIHPDEAIDAEVVVKQDPRFRDALAARDIHDLDLVMVDIWSLGNFGSPGEEGRLAKGLSWFRHDLSDNGYAHPIEGLVAVVDLNAMRVVRIEDHGVVPVAMEEGNYDAQRGGVRTDLRALEIVQPEGPSFDLDGYAVRWQGWRLRIGFTSREGLVLHEIGVDDGDRVRPIVHRASFSEMVIPYGDPSPTVYFKNAFDIGEHGLGPLTDSLELGCDCLGEIRYLDAALADSRGNVRVLKNAICIHEEDAGLLWKHYDWRTGGNEVRRARRLVISSIATVGNYEYGFYWCFGQDGSIDVEVKLTGILHTRGVPTGTDPPHATVVAPGVAAPVHQHFFNVRLDMCVDGARNSVSEISTRADDPGPENPHGNAFHAHEMVLASELAARRNVAPAEARHWRIWNPHVRNRLGNPVAYDLVPGDNVPPFASKDSSFRRRAGFVDHHLWVTPHDPAERFAAGDYPNQHAGGEGLPAWTADDRSIEDADLVVWYTFGAHHIPRPEDWPVMPVVRIGFSLRPRGFFDTSPVLRVPPPTGHDACAHHP